MFADLDQTQNFTTSAANDHPALKTDTNWWAPCCLLQSAPITFNASRTPESTSHFAEHITSGDAVERVTSITVHYRTGTAHGDDA